MADSLGEKLREAREAKGISISEISEQTRISSLYLESIENDDYRALPGGIFNKGFVKSFAKYVGLDEQEAMRDYAKVAVDKHADSEPTRANYDRPKVMTDDSSRPSMLPTIIIAFVVLGIMAWGVFAIVNYVNDSESQTAEDNIANANFKQDVADQEAAAASKDTKADVAAKDLEGIKVSIKSSAPAGLSIDSRIDGKHEIRMINEEVPEQIFDAKDSLIVSYYKGSADTVTLVINGKKIETPLPPPNMKRNGFEYAITKDNLKQILETGKITIGVDPTPTPAANASPAAN